MIILIGYMGAGKTTLGKALAAELGCTFCDLDWYIEQKAGQTIPQIFAERGEEAFRKLEAEALDEVLSVGEGVLSVGGGTPCFFDNIDRMNLRANTIYLKAEPETLKDHIRMGGSKRPLVDGKSDSELMTYIADSLHKREPFYMKAKHILNIKTITTDEHIGKYVEQLKKMTQKKLTIIKVGGKIVEEPDSLKQLLDQFAQIDGAKLLVHGGGRSATQIAARLGIETRMIDGRRITDEPMLEVVTMVYGGLVNKTIVAKLQAIGINAIGLTGADMNIIRSHRREAKPVDFGYVGDVDCVDALQLSRLIEAGITPVIAPLTHNKQGDMLNTNADTIAGEVAKALSEHYDVTLVYCFEKAGVLLDENDDNSVIPHITRKDFDRLVAENIIQGGMIPKLQNSLQAVEAGVGTVVITKATALGQDKGTKITK